MKTLRLFVSYNLDEPINWVMVNEDGSAGESGEATFKELAEIENSNVEVYLNTSCCSIFKTKVAGISTKRLTEELVLGILEDQLVDDVNESRAIVLRTDDIAYVAVFNREYYEALLDQLSTLNKTVLFIQSIAYATIYEEKCFTVFLDGEHSFIRTGQYEYCMLDDNTPLPTLLEDAIVDMKPQKIYLYAKNPKSAALIESKFEIPCQLMRNDELIFGDIVWNFYNQKSTKFKLKLELKTQSGIKNSLKLLKWFSLFLVIIWVFLVIFLGVNNFRLNSQLKHDLKQIVSVSGGRKELMRAAQDKIMQMYHIRGIYSVTDAIPLMQTFLEVVSTVGTKSITQIKYDHNQLEVFLNDSFSPSQFVSYKNIFLVKQITADIIDYKAYAKAHKSQEGEANDNNTIDSRFGEKPQMQIDDSNTKWVITLAPIKMKE